ncbi:MAG TPA: hypothetical protein VK335_33405 [Bryobacteraceae bacterium]|nr:hypothetical protein [Bryobacteraceae bacterium]
MRLWLVAGVLLVAASARAQRGDNPLPPEFFDTHPTALDSAHFQRVFQNAFVEVIRVRLGPHERTAWMEIPAHVMTCVSDQHVRLIYPHGKPSERVEKAGYTGWIERDDYGIENLEDKPAEWILVVPRSGEKG